MVSVLVFFSLINSQVSSAIPTEPNGGNHTIGFTKAAASQQAHDATMVVSKGLAHTAFRALRDDDFFKQVSLLPIRIMVLDARDRSKHLSNPHEKALITIHKYSLDLRGYGVEREGLGWAG